MFQIELMNLVEMLIVADGPREWLASPRWPLHQALVEMRHAGTGDLIGLPEIVTRPHPDVGLRVDGADAAIQELAACGALQLRRDGLLAIWEPTAEAVRDGRRRLWSCSPAESDRK